jgi:hypothetical protein
MTKFGLQLHLRSERHKIGTNSGWSSSMTSMCISPLHKQLLQNFMQKVCWTREVVTRQPWDRSIPDPTGLPITQPRRNSSWALLVDSHNLPRLNHSRHMLPLPGSTADALGVAITWNRNLGRSTRQLVAGMLQHSTDAWAKSKSSWMKTLRLIPTSDTEGGKATQNEKAIGGSENSKWARNPSMQG